MIERVRKPSSPVRERKREGERERKREGEREKEGGREREKEGVRERERDEEYVQNFYFYF